ncbi:hypothetical protein O4N72_15230 [Vibrio parahaemolyticus]|uniref:hypothetical protein n=1 Tax=Vibrio parahaemolyticus TaxID=670 RepID=UPI0022B2CB4E|nr:hypothetical protein [Vibrio parahaemolyticus]MCZ6375628.1 hypothetical protein [Vibrio parahaemolyticus]
MKTVNSVLVSLTTLALTACGGGDSSNSGSTGNTTAMTGKVIDGYVVGATVFLDINNNGMLDSDEPNAISSLDGDYKLDLTDYQAQCATVVPTIVQVPIGAEDMDLGVVKEAYEMVIPPSYDPLAELSDRHLTPLTTMLWESVESNGEFATNSKGKHCDEIWADQAGINQSRTILENQMRTTSMHYNISEEDIYSDFIARGDESLTAKAQEIVRGLQKGYADTLTLNKNLDDNQEGNISYYFNISYSSDGLDTEVFNWRKDVMISTFDANVNNTSNIITNIKSDLETEISLYGSTQSVYQEFDNYNIESFVAFHDWSNNGNYTCQIRETLTTFVENNQYVISNDAFGNNMTDITECTTENAQEIERIKEIRLMDSKDSWNDFTAASNVYFADSINDLHEFYNFAENHETLDLEAMIANLNSVVYTDFDLNLVSDADHVSKMWFYMDGENSVQVHKNIVADNVVDNMIRVTIYPNHTRKHETSFDGGLTWEDTTKIK